MVPRLGSPQKPAKNTPPDLPGTLSLVAYCDSRRELVQWMDASYYYSTPRRVDGVNVQGSQKLD